VLVVAALVFMLAGPRVRASRFVPSWESAPPADVVVVLDHSLSTGYPSAGKTVFDRAVEATSQAVGKIRAGGTISIVLAEHSPRPLTDQPVKGHDRRAIENLQHQLRRQKPGMTDCSIPAAIAAAGRLLETGDNTRKLILVVSDQQRLKWHVGDEALWREAVDSASPAEIVSVPIHGDTELANASVGPLTIEPKFIGGGRPVQIHTTINNAGTKPLSGLLARLSIDGRLLATQPVDPIGPGSATDVNFDLQNGVESLSPTTPSHIVTVSLEPPDALTADNTSSAVINVSGELPVLIVDGQFSNSGGSAGSRFLAAAMQPNESSLLKPKVMSLFDAARADLDPYMAVVLNDCPTLPPALRDRLLPYVQAGHGVWCIAGQRTQKTEIESELAAAQLLAVSDPQIKKGNSSLTATDANHPIIAAAGKDRNAFVGAQVRQWWSLRAIDPDVQILLATSEGDPLVLEHPVGSGGGQFVLWTTGVDGKWNNLHLMPNFVPLVTETLYRLIAPRLRGLENRGLVAGEPIEWMGMNASPPGPVNVTLPDDTVVRRQPTALNGRWVLTFPDTFEPGTYQLDFSGGSLLSALYAVNVDHRALDRAALDSNDIAWFVAHRVLDSRRPTVAADQLDRVLRAPPDQVGLWGLLGTLVVALLLFETWMTRRMTKRREPIQGGSILQMRVTSPMTARRIA
jgi:hypothetical protein